MAHLVDNETKGYHQRHDKSDPVKDECRPSSRSPVIIVRYDALNNGVEGDWNRTQERTCWKLLHVLFQEHRMLDVTPDEHTSKKAKQDDLENP